MANKQTCNWELFSHTVEKCSNEYYLPLLPVTGSGFNRFFTQPQNEKDYAICSWEKLLLAVTKPSSIVTASWKFRSAAPAIMWEEMVTAFAKAENIKPGDAEGTLRQCIANVLNDEVIIHNKKNEDLWSEFLEQSYVSPITCTLNFETRWLTEKPFSWPEDTLLSRRGFKTSVRLVSD
jgi:hypothetical protein